MAAGLDCDRGAGGSSEKQMVGQQEQRLMSAPEKRTALLSAPYPRPQASTTEGTADGTE